MENNFFTQVAQILNLFFVFSGVLYWGRKIENKSHRGSKPELDVSGTRSQGGKIKNRKLEDYSFWGSGGSPSSPDDRYYSRGKRL